MAKKKMGLLVMAYGTPRSEEEIEPFYTHIRRGRKPSQEQLDDLVGRYQDIGGISPLARITTNQAQELCAELNKRYDDVEFHVYEGLKHIDPFIEDAILSMKNDGIEEAVSIVLAPHYSTFSVKSYNGRAQEESELINGPAITSVESWYDDPKFIDFWAEGIRSTREKMSEEEKASHCVIFSAHSLPEKILAGGDPYPDQLKETARLIAEKAGVENYEIGWQSEGNTPDPWIGPDVQDLTRDLHEKHGYQAYMYCPVGFVADHLEVLFDNDYECKVVTDEVGAGYYRPPMPNTEPEFIDSLADVVQRSLKKQEV
ncbi:ferrochelatase [Alkalicoccus chagannorensis]|uniref:ferrochelatase n=1 Tax=Alkalicoccus chagannorensis TaxID=427072 RepID=UPI000413AAFD|nr:ferrochelatase [Alkalicoccus chagannorensis]